MSATKTEWTELKAEELAAGMTLRSCAGPRTINAVELDGHRAIVTIWGYTRDVTLHYLLSDVVKVAR